MKLQVFILILFALSTSSFASVNGFTPFYRPFELEAKVQEIGAHIPMLQWVEELKSVYSEIISIRHKVANSTSETAEVMDLFNKIDTTKVCNTCQFFVKEVRKVADTKILENYLFKIALSHCLKTYNRTVCEQTISTFGDIVFQSALDRVLKPKQVCEGLAMCPKTTEYERVKDYVKEILKDKPAQKQIKPTKKSTYTVLQLSDPHVDLEYKIGTDAFCGSSLCCREESGAAPNASHAAKYWGTVAKCDLPLRTFEQFAQFVSKKFDIDMIIWTGDNIAHDIWNQKQETQTDNTFDITQVLLKHFPNTYVYPMFGNHEAYPCDQFDTIGNSSAWLTSKLAEMWKEWLTEDALNTFREKSYYSIVNHEHNVKIIALDTQACDTQDYYLIRDPTDPMGELEWLRNELYESEKKNQGVFIMGHIPPGVYSCYSQWSARYSALVERFSNTIRGQFFGHTHVDEFEVIRSYEDNTPVGIVYVAPSFTTFSNHLPSFRIYEIDSETHVPVNYYQYVLDLNKWNKVTVGPIEWDLRYELLKEYKMEDLSPKSFDNIAESIKLDPNVAETYNFHKHSGYSKKKNLSEREVQNLYCSAKHSVSEDVLKCLGLHAQVNDIMKFAKQLLPGLWYYDQC